MARGFGMPAYRPAHLSSCLWWMRADLDYHLHPTLTSVARWADQSGNGHHAVQAVALKQPLWIASSLNGRPGLSFDNTDGPRCLRIPAITYGSATGLTCSLVLSDTSTEANSTIIEGAAGAGSVWMVYANTTAGWVEVRVASATQENGVRFSDTLATTRRLIFTIDRTIAGGVGTSEIAVWVDGTQPSLTQTQTQNPTGAFSDVALNFGARNDGAALGWKGVLHETAGFNRILTAAEIARLDTYHAEQWGL